MDPLTDTLSLAELFGVIRTYLEQPRTGWQLLVILGGLPLAWLAGTLLQRRLQPAIAPGVVSELPRMAMRTGVLVLVPLLLWIWLLAWRAVLRRHGMPLDVLNVAILLTGAFTLIRMGVFVLRHSFAPGSRLKAWERTLTVTMWGIVALHLLGWLPLVHEALDEYAIVLGQTRLSLYSLIVFSLTVILLLVVALWFANAIRGAIQRSEAMDSSVKVAVSNLIRFGLLVAAVLVAMVASGIDITALAVFGGALGVGLGLGLQRVVSNFVSGIILSFEGSVRPGHVISVGDTFGVVEELHSRYIVVKSRDGVENLIPNEHLLTNPIINWSYGDNNVRFRLPVQISYHDDPEQAMSLMLKAAQETPRVLSDPEPTVRLMGFGDNGINLELRIWINDPENGVNNARSDTYLRIWRAFREANITIPFPQREVRLMADAAPAKRPSAGTPGNPPESARGRKRADWEADPD